VTELLYHTDSYLREFQATVTRIEGDKVALDRTAFYPTGGGQACDRGWLRWAGGEVAVIEARKQGDDVLHTVEGVPPPEGSPVTGVLDWERRHLLMRTHSALHILCGVIWRDYGALVTGGSMDLGQARMDFELERMSSDFASEIEARVNAEIAAARPIEARVLPREEAFQIPDLIRTKINLLPPAIAHVRTVEIKGLDLQADGGTHVANTAEVGHIRVVGHESKGRINKRLRIALD
jgi:misacylated tRNA(Ala) deacylase